MGSTSQWTLARPPVPAEESGVPPILMASAPMSCGLREGATTRVRFLRPINIVAPMGLGVVARQISPGSSKRGVRMLIATHKMTRPALSLALAVPTTGLHFVHEKSKSSSFLHVRKMYNKSSYYYTTSPNNLCTSSSAVPMSSFIDDIELEAIKLVLLVVI
ncbi:hypothetical protein OIU79_008622 [Salix purpurea]|uniref:Uncharacterized protein n=1 Tax=Salix purpurea TaxID=77065 RepID=A0A9Q0TIY4_SALPP|nr:hypothetical protein OIU79_008622 [Salix purpurea]